MKEKYPSRRINGSLDKLIKEFQRKHEEENGTRITYIEASRQIAKMFVKKKFKKKKLTPFGESLFDL